MVHEIASQGTIHVLFEKLKAHTTLRQHNLCRWPWRCIIGVITETQTTHQMIHSLSWHNLCRWIPSVFLGHSSVEPFSLMDHCWNRMDAILSLAWCLAFHPFFSIHLSSTMAICLGAVATVYSTNMYCTCMWKQKKVKNALIAHLSVVLTSSTHKVLFSSPKSKCILWWKITFSFKNSGNGSVIRNMEIHRLFYYVIPILCSQNNICML